MKDLRIVQANVKDAQKIALFLRHNFKIHNLKFGDRYITDSFSQGIWLLAKTNNEILGAVLLKTIKDDNRGELKHLLVKEGFRGQHIGKALLSEAIKSAKKRKFRKITGMAASGNLKIFKKTARAFNFKLEGILKNHYRKNEDVYIYSLFM